MGWGVTKLDNRYALAQKVSSEHKGYRTELNSHAKKWVYKLRVEFGFSVKQICTWYDIGLPYYYRILREVAQERRRIQCSIRADVC